MKNDKLNLDDIFAKARQEEPVMSESDVNRLISDYAKPPAHGFFKKFLTGDKKMISLIGATAAAISVIFFSVINVDMNQNNNSNTQTETGKYSFLQNEKASVDAEKPNILPTNNKKNHHIPQLSHVSDIDNESMRFVQIDDEKKSEDTVKQGLVEPKALNHDIKGIKSLRLLPEEIKALGIEVDPSGDFISVLLSKNNPRLRKIFVDWGVGYNDKDALVENPEKYLIPRMITDNRGMRRIEIISNEGTDISIDRMTDNDSLNQIKMFLERSGVKVDYSKNNPSMSLTIDNNNPNNLKAVMALYQALTVNKKVESEDLDMKRNHEEFSSMLDGVTNATSDILSSELYQKLKDNPDDEKLKDSLQKILTQKLDGIIPDNKRVIRIERNSNELDLEAWKKLYERAGHTLDSNTIQQFKMNVQLQHNPKMLDSILKNFPSNQFSSTDSSQMVIDREFVYETNTNVDKKLILNIENLDTFMTNVNQVISQELLLRLQNEPDNQSLKDSIANYVSSSNDKIFPNRRDFNWQDSSNKEVRILVDKRERNPDGTVKDDRKYQLTFNDKTPDIKFNLPEIDINKLLPVEIPLPNAKDKQGNVMKDFSFILWLSLDAETYELLPERLRREVKPEFDALTKTEGAVCGFSPNEDGENYLDVWRTCAGAIEELNASPNPTDGIVNLSFLLKENRNVTITVNDVFGKKVQDVVVNRRMNKGEILESFHLNAPEAGMYLVVVQTNAGEQAVHRVILSK